MRAVRAPGVSLEDIVVVGFTARPPLSTRAPMHAGNHSAIACSRTSMRETRTDTCSSDKPLFLGLRAAHADAPLPS
jgi:hypothetical protein